jgi:hypothetical protein
LSEAGPVKVLRYEHFRTEFGFAYSGSTLSALCAHALANIVCSNLVGLENFEPPTIDDVAVAMGGISLHYMREIGQLSAHAGLFKAILFGICPRANEAIAFEMKPKVEPTEINLEIVKHKLTNDSVVVIGEKEQLLHDRIAEVRSSAEHPIIFADAPQRALQSLIDDGSIASVGGTIQQAWATRGKLELVATARPIQPRPPAPRNVGLFLLGFDIMDMQNIGACRISMTGR